jgi:hypothetical protein
VAKLHETTSSERMDEIVIPASRIPPLVARATGQFTAVLISGILVICWGSGAGMPLRGFAEGLKADHPAPRKTRSSSSAGSWPAPTLLSQAAKPAGATLPNIPGPGRLRQGP